MNKWVSVMGVLEFELISDSASHAFPSWWGPGFSLGQSFTHKSLKIVFIKWLGDIFISITHTTFCYDFYEALLGRLTRPQDYQRVISKYLQHD